MSEQPVVYAVPTHLTTREPFVFGRSLDEFAKLIAVACVALKLAFSDGFPVPVRLPLVDATDHEISHLREDLAAAGL